MDPLQRFSLNETRREFLKRAAQGMGTMALASLLNPADAFGGIAGPDPHPALQFAPKAKRIIYLYQAGGPSHLETLDYKPELARMHGQPMPESLTAGQQIAQLQGQELVCLGPQYGFKRWGKSGQEISEQFPHIGSIADDICIVRSMQTEQINHDPAHTFMNTGSIIQGRPSMGAWLSYGLGVETENLPGFVVLTSEGGGQAQPIAARQWHSGFLPGQHQGVRFQSAGDPVLYASPPAGVSLDAQREVVDAVQGLNALKDKNTSGDFVQDPELSTRISQYELAFRMQMSVPELVDFSSEPDYIKQLYGTEGADGSFASNCLLARRLAERGVRFIQLYHRGWDHHGNVKGGIDTVSKLVDQASAALIMDLKQRGMLDDTLVIWGGEFGRTPMGQGRKRDGRDHHIKAFSLWMAGGGIKPGVSYGKTDDFGYDVAENPVHVHDLHATILRLMGMDHKKLSYRYQGRDFRLTDVHGNVVQEILR
ncbi:MAG: DUF1501 domain-containing protein [Rhodothermales bacterium]